MKTHFFNFTWFLVYLITGADAVIPKPTIQCKVVENGQACDFLKQSNVCFSDEKRIKQVRLTSSICSNGVVNPPTQLILRGPAIKSVYNAPIARDWNDMTPLSTNGGCIGKFTIVEVDTCKEYFNAQLEAKTSKGNNFAFESYMKRNCPLQSEITCTSPFGKDCSKLTLDTCENGDFEYQFCYFTTFNQHDITIRPEYSSKDTAVNCAKLNYAQGCDKETHAYMNGWGQDFLPGLSQSKVIGGRTTQIFCLTHTEYLETCKTRLIPKAFMNVVGEVTAAFGPNSVPIEDFKPCFTTTVYKDIELNPNDNPPGCSTSADKKKGKGSTKSNKKPGKRVRARRQTLRKNLM